MKYVSIGKSKALKKTNNLFILFAITWTALVLGLFLIYYNNEKEATLSSARTAAVYSLRKDLIYRNWASSHGGVYVPVTEHTRPNQYLSTIPDRDVETTSGKKLTLINPAFMNRQAYELEPQKDAFHEHVTSLNPTRPEDEPDAWEKKALLSFQDGASEFFGLEKTQDTERYRYMVPLRVEPSCVKCHIHQDYKVGELRGGLSVSVPWHEFDSALKSKSKTVLGLYGIVWFVGLIGGFGAKRVITSQINAQEATLDTLTKSERMLSTVLQATSVGIGLIKDRVIQWTNDAMSPMTGYSTDELCGHLTKDFYESDEEYERAGALMYSEITVKSKSTVETRFRRKDGTVLEVLMNLSAVDKTDPSAGAVFVLMDIGESKRMARQIEENVLRMERAELAAKFGNWELDPQDNIVRLSSGASTIEGTQRRQIPLSELIQLLLPEHELLMSKAWEDLIQHHKPYDVEFEFLRHSDRQVIHVHSIAGVDAESGLVWGVIQDITSQKKAEKALLRSEARHRMLTENMKDVIWSADPTTKFTYVSPSIRNLLGYEPEEMLEKTYFDLLSPEIREKFLPIYNKRINTIGEQGPVSSKTYEVEVLGKDDSRIWVEVVSNPNIDSEGNLVGFQGVTRDINRRKQAEEALAESELLYRTVFEGARESIIIIDLEGDSIGRIVSANPAAAEMHGYSLDEFTTLRMGDLESPDSAKGLQARIDTVLSGKLLKGEVNHRRKDGSVFPLEISANLIEISGHKYCIGIDRDITERKLSEDAIRESESKFRNYVESSPVGIFETDSDGRLVSANKACSSISGYSNQALLQMGVFDFMPPDRITEYSGQFQRLTMSKDLQVDVEVVTANGHIIWESVSATKLAENRFLFFVIDITDRKKAEEDLKRASNETLQLMKSMTNGFVVFESVFDETGEFADCRYLYVNDSFERISGLNGPEIIGKTVYQVWPGTEEAWIRNFRDVVLSGKPKTFEMYHGPTDKLLYCSVYRPWESIDRFCLIFEDITEKRHAQEELMEMERRLLQSQKLESLGVLSGGIAHDFNNLLAIIIGNIELAQETDFNSSERDHFLKRAMSASMKSAGLVRQMLDYSGRGAFELKDVNLSELVENNIDMFRMTVPKNINLKVDSSDDDIFVKADVSQIQQVIMNLLINASEAFNGKNGSIEITIGATYCDESILSRSHLPEKPKAQEMAFVRVTDDGIGMDIETIDRIFDPFFSTKFVGRGLGMSVIHGVVRGHQGAVTIDSQPGTGTTITVYLPLLYCTGNLDKVTNEPEIGNMSAIEKSSLAKKFTVLVVDDEKQVLDLVMKQLQHLGCKTLSARNGKEALDVFARNIDIDLVILDLIMPEMGGVEAFHRLMELNPELKIVLCSGYKEEYFKDEFKTGIQPFAFLDKPYRFSTMKSLIQRLEHAHDRQNEP